MIDRLFFKSSYSLFSLIFLYFLSLPMSYLEAGIKPKSQFASKMVNSPLAPIVVIDAGHGGRDRGTKSKQPYCEEKRICLQTARLVRKYLDQLGYRVILTRNNDVFVPLPRRVEIATQAMSSVFVSIHYNSAKNPIAKGIEVFFHDSKEDRSRSVASKRLAEVILPGIIRRTEAVSRGVKKGNFYVIRENTMPAIIVEGGFISNPEECSLIKSAEYQDKIARGIADGIDRYFKMKL